MFICLNIIYYKTCTHMKQNKKCIYFIQQFDEGKDLHRLISEQKNILIFFKLRV